LYFNNWICRCSLVFNIQSFIQRLYAIAMTVAETLCHCWLWQTLCHYYDSGRDFMPLLWLWQRLYAIAMTLTETLCHCYSDRDFMPLLWLWQRLYAITVTLILIGFVWVCQNICFSYTNICFHRSVNDVCSVCSSGLFIFDIDFRKVIPKHCTAEQVYHSLWRSNDEVIFDIANRC